MIKNYIKLNKDNISTFAGIGLFLVWILWNKLFGVRIINYFTTNIVMLNFNIYIVSNLLLILILIFIGKNKISLKVKWKEDIYIIIAALGTIMFFDNVTYYLNALFSVPVNTQNSEVIMLMEEQSPTLTFLVTVFLGPLSEELIYRVGFFKILSNTKLKSFWIVFITSTIFGFEHIYNAVIVNGKIYELISLISYSGAGIVFGAIYIKEKRFSLILIIHILSNFLTYL